MKIESPCRFLEWDSEFFSLRIGRVEVDLDDGTLPEIHDWARQQRIDCLYYLCPSDDYHGVGLAQEDGFHYVDTRLTLALHGNPQAPEPRSKVRLASEQDIPALKAVAACNHRNTRFYKDGHFPTAQCDQMYEVWIEKSCRGYADAVQVLEAGGEAVGYTTCTIHEGTGEIGLVGIRQDLQGRGYGTDLVYAGLHWFQQKGCRDVRVVTQGDSLPAVKLYLKCGFRPHSIELWFHKWFSYV
jgi:dTDP-4-amino-4,6-dideoxy-D-galactose acyltransferase